MGKKFSGVLENSVKAGGSTVIRSGTTVYGEIVGGAKARRIAGRAQVLFELTDVRIDGELIPIYTETVHYVATSALKSTARGAAGGSIIGAIAGDAGVGAAIGATAGALKKGPATGASAGSLIEFHLSVPLRVARK